MKLLFVTQVVDKNDGVLGAYHGWLTALAPHYEQIEVICLKEGEHQLPENVEVHSLGKEKGKQHPLVYSIRFLCLIWQLRNSYDAVLVHMNQEYLLLAGPAWKLLGKRMYLWRNHYAGSFLTDLAAVFCTKVFCTSKSSYTAKYRKAVLMPVGINLRLFHEQPAIARIPRSILFLARIAPSKRPDLFIDALGLLLKKGVSFIASIYGDPRSEDQAYYASLKARAESLGLHDRVRFHTGVANIETPTVYATHEFFVNCSPSGMFDKTLFEAAACGCIVLAISSDFMEVAGTPGFQTAEELAEQLQNKMSLPEPALHELQKKYIELAQDQDLNTLIQALVRECRV